MSEWTTTDSEWLDDLNAELIPAPKPVYKYNASHFAHALDQFRAAGEDYKKYQEIIMETIVYLTSFDPKNATVTKMVSEYKNYLSSYNWYVNKVNSEFADILLAVMPTKNSFT